MTSVNKEAIKRKKQIIILVAVMCLLLVMLIVTAKVSHVLDVKRVYDEGVTLVAVGKYTDAKAVFKPIRYEEYRDVESYYNLCEAHEYYELQMLEEAYREAREMKFKTLSDEDMAKIEAFFSQIKTEYEEYEAGATERYFAELEEKVRTGVPFVGMPEREIANTILGAPQYPIKHNRECVNGLQYECNLYRFCSEGRMIFSARCMEGYVINVWDLRNEPPVAVNYSTSSSEDRYNASSYSNEEDFYYDNYDDFTDYDEAEWYWNENH